MGHRTRSARGYDTLAGAYRWLEKLTFANELQRARLALLDGVPPVQTALFFGDGDGRLLEAFLRRQPRCRVTSVDQSGAMIDRQRRRLRRRGLDSQVSWRQLDARDVPAETESVELIVTPFFLDCFTREELTRLVPRIGRSLSPAGLWYVVDFQYPPGGGWRARRAAIWLAAMHTFFGYATGLETRRLVDPDPILAANGFECIARADRNGALITSRMYRLAGASQ